MPESDAYWVVDPLDGTTNFAAGIPYWAISIARFVNGRPVQAFLDVPALRQRIVAIQGQGAWRNGKRLTDQSREAATSSCVSLCSRSIRVLQRRPDQPFPGKIHCWVWRSQPVECGAGADGGSPGPPKIWVWLLPGWFSKS